VLIGSDEFVNLIGSPSSATANFIIDGGSFSNFFSTDTRITFRLEVGASNLGNVGAETNASTMSFSAREAAGFGSAGGFFAGFNGGGYTATYETGSNGVGSLTDFFEGGLDLAAALASGPGGQVVEIPFSLQSLDLGFVNPGDRLLVAYLASIEIFVGGITEGSFAEFSDPFSIAESIRTSIVFEPASAVPVAGSLPLFALGILAKVGANRRRSQQPSQ
jgi:hypothetical protein